MISQNTKTELISDRIKQPISNLVLTPRIIQFNGKRLCIRLEQTYWEILEDMARAQSLKLNALVHVLYLDPLAGNNKTAYLRLRAVNWLSEKVTSFENKVSFDQSEAHAILRTTDQPAIIFTSDQSISACNEQFRNWLSKNLTIRKAELDMDKVRVSFLRAYNVLVRKIDTEGGALKGEQVSILLPGYVLSTSVNLTNLTAINPETRTFMGFFSTKHRQF